VLLRHEPDPSREISARSKTLWISDDPTKLQVEERTWDSAMFNLAIHNKLRGRVPAVVRKRKLSEQ
jgi:hypothetical protein